MCASRHKLQSKYLEQVHNTLYDWDYSAVHVVFCLLTSTQLCKTLLNRMPRIGYFSQQLKRHGLSSKNLLSHLSYISKMAPIYM